MNLHRRAISIAATVALVTGAVAVAATPATAKVIRTPSGGTVITVPLATLTGAAAAGVDITAIKPAMANATGDGVGIAFPAQMPKTDGVLPHRGGLSLASSKTSIALTWRNPAIDYPTSGGDTAVISGIVNGIPDSNPLASLLNGKPLALFDVKNFTTEWKIGKVTKVGKKYRKVLTQTMTGDVHVTDNATVVGGLNSLMGVALFTAGAEFGTLDTEWSVTITCDTAKECK